MSVPASEMGGVGSVDTASQVAIPTASGTPPTATANPSSWTSGLNAIPSFANMLQGLNPFSKSPSTSVLPNLALVAVGIVLALGALLISQKQVIVPGVTAA